MKIIALLENTAGVPFCAVEHGLSLYIETDRHKILFDAGESGRFARNAEKLGVDLTQVDIAFLSHGHYDHAGGMTEFLRINQKAKLYVNEDVFRPHYSAIKRYIGVEPALFNNPRVVTVGDRLEIDDELTLMTYNDQPCPYGVNSYGLTEEIDNQPLPDPFHHEQYLKITQGESRVLISGCTHKGIRNLMHWTKDEGIQVLIGGFHFMEIEPERYHILDETVAELLQYPVEYYTCHCTGQTQYRYMKGKMGELLHYLAAGDVINV